MSSKIDLSFITCSAVFIIFLTLSSTHILPDDKGKLGLVNLVLAAEEKADTSKQEEIDKYIKQQREIYLPHVEEYLAGLKHPNPSQRAIYVDLLGKAGDPRAVESLLEVIENDSSKMVRGEAINVIASFKDKRAVPIIRGVLEEGLTEKEPGVVLNASDALIKLGDADYCIPFLTSIFLKENFDSWIVDLGERTDWNEEKKEKEIEYSKNRYPGLAWIRLRKFGGPKIEEIFRSALSSEDEWIRNCAKLGLDELSAPKVVVDKIGIRPGYKPPDTKRDEERKKEWDERRKRELEELRARVPELLEEFKKSKDPDDRLRLADLLVESQDPRVFPTLLEVIKTDADEFVKGDIIKGIADFNDEKAIPVLKNELNRAFQAKSMGRVLSASDALIQLREEGCTMPFLKSVFLKEGIDSWTYPRIEKRTDLRLLEKKKSIKRLKGDFPTRALSRLKRIGGPQVIDIFISALGNEDEWVRNHAKIALDELTQ